MIYIDPSEAREGSRLPSDVQKQAIVLPGLEKLTSADLLVTLTITEITDIYDIASDPLTQTICHLAWTGVGVTDIVTDTGNSLPFVLKVLLFRKMCREGILVQRKTGRDVTSFIPNHNGALILNNMLNWCPESWLLVVDCRVGCSGKGNLIVNGEATEYRYSQLSSTLQGWQRRGGFIEWVSRDKLVLPWLNRQARYLKDRTDEKVLDIRKPLQTIVGPDEDRSRALAILSGLKNVGAEKAKLLLDHYGTLAGALEAVLDPDFVQFENRPKGFGKATVVENRRLFGLTESWMKLAVIGDTNGTEDL